MRADNPEVSPQRQAASRLVRAAISHVLLRLYEHDRAEPVPGNIATLLARLDGGPEASVRDQASGGNRVEGVS